jgi:hypothetical protein
MDKSGTWTSYVGHEIVPLDDFYSLVFFSNFGANDSKLTALSRLSKTISNWARGICSL